MKTRLANLMVYLSATAIAFFVGFDVSKLLSRHRHDRQPRTIYAKPLASRPALTLLTFESTGSNDLAMVDWLSSDGFNVRYGCFDYPSPNRAMNELRHETLGTHPFSESATLDVGGVKLGHRVAWIFPGGARIEWTNGRRLFVVDATSHYYALAFEQSRAWASQDCADLTQSRFYILEVGL